MHPHGSFFEVSTKTHDLILNVPGSKSHATRLLILGSLVPDDFIIRNCPNCSDVTNLEKSLKDIGLEISRMTEMLVIRKSFPSCETLESINLSPGNGGTTNRFLMGLLGHGRSLYQIELHPEILKRPMKELFSVLNYCGVSVNVQNDILKLRGPYRTDLERIEIDCTHSTQFLSAMKMTFFKESIQFDIKNFSSSKKYVDLTDNLIYQVNKGERDFNIPTDLSSLSYAIAYAMLGHQVTVKNYQFDELQADSKIIQIANQIGLTFQESDNKLMITPSQKYSSFEVDMSDCLDLAPALSFMASLCEGTSRLKNLKKLKYKESDRLHEIINLLKQFEVSHRYKDAQDVLEIRHSLPIKNSVNYQGAADHRMVMTAYLFMKRNSGGLIYNYHCVEKSWPYFFKVMES